MHIFFRLRDIRERRLVRLQRRQFLAQADEKAGIKTGANLARITQLAILVIPEQQSAKADPAAFRISEAANDKLLLRPTLEFQPVARASGYVDAVGALCDHAFPAFCGKRLGSTLFLQHARDAR